MKLSGILFACVFSAVAVQSLAAKRPLVVGAEQAQTRIVMLDPDVVSPEPAKIVWEWKPAKDANLMAAGLADKFDNVDECKPSDDGKRILVCASRCGFAVVDVASLAGAEGGSAGATATAPITVRMRGIEVDVPVGCACSDIAAVLSAVASL